MVDETSERKFYGHLALFWLCLVPSVLGVVLNIFTPQDAFSIILQIVPSMLMLVPIFPYAYLYILIFSISWSIYRAKLVKLNGYMTILQVNRILLLVFAAYWTFLVDSSKLFLGE